MFTSLADPSAEPGFSSTELDGRHGLLVATHTPSARRLFADYLTDCGFAVWTADSGVEALDVFVRHMGSIEAVVADAGLPDLPGVELAALFHRHFPGVPVCVLSDEPFGTVADEVREIGATVVAKPVHLRRLVQALSAELDS